MFLYDPRSRLFHERAKDMMSLHDPGRQTQKNPAQKKKDKELFH
jgi:hypothetical protein